VLLACAPFTFTRILAASSAKPFIAALPNFPDCDTELFALGFHENILLRESQCPGRRCITPPAAALSAGVSLGRVRRHFDSPRCVHEPTRPAARL
jgi:hypothetical protein